MTKKIAYLGIKGLPSQAGADRVVEAIVRGLDGRKFQPVVYCSNKVVPEGTHIPGVQLIRMPTLPGKHLHATSLFLFAALHALFLGNYDLVHVHNVEACFILPLLRLRFKVISTSHGAAQARDKWGGLAKRLIRLTEYPYILFSNHRTSVSAPLAEYYRRQYKRPVQFLPNGVDSETRVDMETAVSLLQQYNIKPEYYILFAAGRIIPTKGCHYLLQAFRQLDTDMQLLIIGDTTHLPAYEKQLKQLADHRVHFIPFISNKETLFGLVRAARLFIFPSTVEAMSMMLLEVASLNTPIICSNIPENRTVLPEQALFFKSANVSDLQTKLSWGLDNYQQMEDLAAQAKERIGRNYLWDNIVRQYETIYEAI